MNISEENSQKE